MSVLVGYATEKGSTGEIAQRIASRLCLRGLEVEVAQIADLTPGRPYDAAVLGSALHGGRWLPETALVLPHLKDDLRDLPVWLFSVSSIGATSSFFSSRVAAFMRRMRSETTDVRALRGRFKVRGHRDFAGVIAKGDWSPVGDVFLRMLGGTFGDHRDWVDVDDWCDRIAEELLSGR